jgi:hypothetical protein
MSSSLRRTGLAPPDERPPRWTMKVVQLTLPLAILTIVFLATGRTTSAGTAGVSKGTLEPRLRIAKTAMEPWGKAITDIIQYHELRDNKPSTSRTSYEPMLSTGAGTTLCSTSRVC